ncbi:hypothetical protein GWI33_008498 [Rhynchophorus ferrugineus]|uniref:Poly(A)-specific ribonuclease RNA-binding domain-containing protein n=1 Tax=Rhynchophorus ferrugineus TaxID=354439 RepID=A0A834MB12_RHYFE|nr:hypothetical protein GWI33_008498 [Rhynchophorus ferrugineus]
MEVTQSNFVNVLPEIEEAIKNCTFISIDCELTGLKTALNHINAFDTPKKFYEKVLNDCKEFLLIQYGLSFFRYEKKNDVFKHKSYNFYIFRKPVKKFLEDQRFMCQTSSIDFLINEGFNFNKLFKEGVSYLNNVEEDSYRANLEEFQRKLKESSISRTNSNDIIPIPDEHKEFIEEIIQKIKDFINSDDTEMEIPRCNGFLRRLIYQTCHQNFSDMVTLETRLQNKDRILFAMKCKTAQEKEDIMEKKMQDMLNTFENSIGFSKVIKKIIESEKIIVGHNMLLDFLHTIHKFVTPLPENYCDFKECASSLFPRVLDTKYISSTEPFKGLVNSTVLGQLLELVSEKPFEMPRYEVEDGCLSYNINDDKQHEAGYDSFITGLILISLWKYLGSKKNLSNGNIFDNLGHKLFDPYLNKIYLMYLTDNQYLNLSGEDLNPSRDHVFHLVFPKQWTTNNIVQLFSPFGAVYIAWISEVSAFVGLMKKDQAAVALKTLSQSDTYSIMTFAKHQAISAGLRPIAPSPLKKRKSNEGQVPNKKRRTDSFDGSSFSASKRSISPIEEAPEEVEENKSNKKNVFEEAEWN